MNSWGDLIWESRATPNRCTYLHFQDLTPKSILEKIWYGSQGLHLIGAPICVFKNLVGLGQSHLALNQSQIALNKLFQVGQSPRQLCQSGKVWLIRIKACLPSTRGLLTRFVTTGAADEVCYHRYHDSWTWQKGIGGLTWVGPLDLRTRAGRAITEVV
jgi:hypothetical protein